MKHQRELENLTLMTQPFKTAKLFIIAVVLYLRQSLTYLLSHVWFMLLGSVVVLAGIMLVITDGLHGKVLALWIPFNF